MPDTGRCGRVEVRAWHGMHQKAQRTGYFARLEAEPHTRLPVIEGTIIGVRVERLPDGRSPHRTMWLWHSGPQAPNSPAPSASSAGPSAQRTFPPEQYEHILAALRADITRKCNLNPARRHRTYPRVVKRARHNSYRVKKASDQVVRHSRPPAIRPANLGSLSLAA